MKLVRTVQGGQCLTGASTKSKRDSSLLIHFGDVSSSFQSVECPARFSPLIVDLTAGYRLACRVLVDQLSIHPFEHARSAAEGRVHDASAKVITWTPPTFTSSMASLPLTLQPARVSDT